jgi:hypothetical protein
MINIVFDLNNTQKRQIPPRPPLSHKKHQSTSNAPPRLRPPTLDKNENPSALLFPPLKIGNSLLGSNGEPKTQRWDVSIQSELKTESSLHPKSTRNRLLEKELNFSSDNNGMNISGKFEGVTGVEGSSKASAGYEKLINISGLQCQSTKENGTMQNLKTNTGSRARSYHLADRLQDPSLPSSSSNNFKELSPAGHRRILSGLIPKKISISFGLKMEETSQIEPEEIEGEWLKDYPVNRLNLISMKGNTPKNESEVNKQTRRTMFCFMFLEDILYDSEFISFFEREKRKAEVPLTSKRKKEDCLLSRFFADIRKAYTVVLLTRASLLKGNNQKHEKILALEKIDFDALYEIESNEEEKNKWLDIETVFKDLKINDIRRIVFIQTIGLKLTDHGHLSIDEFDNFFERFPLVRLKEKSRLQINILANTQGKKSFFIKCHQLLQQALSIKNVDNKRCDPQLSKDLVEAFNCMIYQETTRNKFFNKIYEDKEISWVGSMNTEKTNSSDEQNYQLGTLNDVVNRVSNYFKYNESELKQRSKLVPYNLYSSIRDIFLRNTRIFEQAFTYGYNKADQRRITLISGIHKTKASFPNNNFNSGENQQQCQLESLLSASINIFF